MVLFELSFAYWIWSGTVFLFFLTIQDLLNNMNVDDRRNWFMMGISFSLLSHFNRGIFYVIGLLIIVVLINIIFRRLKPLGIADINSLTWIFFGFGIIGLTYLIWFFIIFFLLTFPYYVLIFVFMRNKPAPFYPVLLLSFFLQGYIFGLY